MALSACSKDRAATCHPLIVLDLFHSGGSNNLSSWDLRVYVQLLSHIQLFVAPWTVARQAPLFMEFSRQEYCSGLPFPTPGDLPGPGMDPGPPVAPAPPVYSKCRFVFYAITAPSFRALKKVDLLMCPTQHCLQSRDSFMASEVWRCVCTTMKSARLTMYCFP